MQVVVYGKTLKEGNLHFVQMLFDTLHDRGINVFVYKPYLKLLGDTVTQKKDVGVFEGYLDLKTKNIDFMITLGGDGTILNAVSEIRDSQVPVMGINMGRLGFLASIEKTRIESAIDLLLHDRFILDTRSLLFLETNDDKLFGNFNVALNDFTILKRDTSSMITINTFINGAYLATYWADGIIISTPTGSTGYSLSCGGPIIFPGSGNFVITPVAPHNLNVRPIVIAQDSVVSFEVDGRADSFLCTLDSRFETVNNNHLLAIRKNDYPFKLVQLEDKNFPSTIREKLAWGVDTRN